MSMKTNARGPLLVIGAGGHAKAVVGAARASGFDVRAVYDDDEVKWGKALLGVPIFGPVNRILDAPHIPVIVGIADAVTRKAFVDRLPLEWATLVHRTAIVDATVELAPGGVVFAGVVVQAGVQVGAHVILNANATVSQDCVLGDYVHLAPGVDIGAGVHIGTGAFIGIGAVAIAGVEIGDWTTVGAGAAVMANLPERVVAVGCPARVLRTLETNVAPTGVDY
jgi:sugar O-acyltransferase (sialic acid O-acetyltransferase NeuD family)